MSDSHQSSARPAANGTVAAATVAHPVDSSHRRARAPWNPGGPVGLVLKLFSSVWFGVTLLSLLFIYCSVGSSGVPVWFNILDPASWKSVAQMRAFELTEFEWFHWWPFDTLIALICLNLVTATLRRIPLNVINLGVWMIHAGIITLALGSVWYFSTKVEGDAPVNRRRVLIEVAGQPPQSMTVLPGNSLIVGEGTEAYAFQIQNIDPLWEIRSGADTGKRAYSVSVHVQSKAGEFVRQVLAGYPQYTEDVIPSNDPAQPMQRAIKAIGKPLMDEALKLSLDYDPQSYFYLKDSRAIYLREIDAAGKPKTDWIQRTISGLPRFNDYLLAATDVWQDPGQPAIDIRPMRSVSVPPMQGETQDPLPQTALGVSRFLRYASIQSRRLPVNSGTINPAVSVRMQSPSGEESQFQLVAFDPQDSAALNGNLMFVWMESPAAMDRLRTRIDPVLHFKLPASGKAVDLPITRTLADTPNLDFSPVEGTDYSFRVQSFQDNLAIDDKMVSLAIIQIRKGDKAWQRWVFDDPTRNRDLAMADGLAQHTAEIPIDSELETVYTPGARPPAPVMILAGPGENDLAVMITKITGQPQLQSVKEGDVVPIAGGVTLTIDRYAPRTVRETKPFVVPREQRDRQMAEMASMIHVDIPSTSGGANGKVQSVWLPYHLYAFAGPSEVLRRFPYQPTTITLEDGRRIEMIYSRERLPLPGAVVLDDFQVDSTIGGFTGRAASITDWKSMVRFDAGGGAKWTEPMKVSVNKPAEFEGYWFFQAQWDPPDPEPRFAGDTGSRGLNYTVLGVGNRNGVNVQLFGACLSVIGMIYAFYVKPIIKRRRQQAVLARIDAGEFGPKAKSRAHHHRDAVEVES